MTHVQSRLIVALSGRRALVPLTLLAFAVIGVFSYRPNPVQGSWAVTAVLSAAFCAWLVITVEHEVGSSADAIFTVLAGGAARAWRGRLALVAMVATAVTLVFLAYPLVWSTWADKVFAREPGVADVAAAALAHLACGAAGGGRTVLACAVTVAQAGLLALGARRLARWRG